MTKKGHQKFWQMKIETNLGNFPRSEKNFRKQKGNLKQGVNASLPQDAPVSFSFLLFLWLLSSSFMTVFLFPYFSFILLLLLISCPSCFSSFPPFLSSSASSYFLSPFIFLIIVLLFLSSSPSPILPPLLAPLPHFLIFSLF